MLDEEIDMTWQELKDVKVRMKPPLSYYGGKQKLSRDICRALYQSPNWSEKGHYIEPFFGGGAVFFAKEPQRMETINDLNDNLITFYRVVKDPAGFEKVKALLDGTLYSRSEFNRAGRILRGEEEADAVLKAWAVFVRLNLSYGNAWSSGFACEARKLAGGGDAHRLQGKIARFTNDCCRRLQNVIIENRDALFVVNNRDSGSALFYLDPPYMNAVQCYGEFKAFDKDWSTLLDTLKRIKGRFLLSCYMSPLIEEAAKECAWFVAKKSVACCVWVRTRGETKTSGKVECLIANYPFHIDGWEVACEYSGEKGASPAVIPHDLQGTLF